MRQRTAIYVEMLMQGESIALIPTLLTCHPDKAGRGRLFARFQPGFC
jgi:hypothetical protein